MILTMAENTPMEDPGRDLDAELQNEAAKADDAEQHAAEDKTAATNDNTTAAIDNNTPANDTTIRENPSEKKSAITGPLRTKPHDSPRTSATPAPLRTKHHDSSQTQLRSPKGSTTGKTAETTPKLTVRRTLRPDRLGEVEAAAAEQNNTPGRQSSTTDGQTITGFAGNMKLGTTAMLKKTSQQGQSIFGPTDDRSTMNDHERQEEAEQDVEDQNRELRNEVGHRYYSILKGRYHSAYAKDPNASEYYRDYMSEQVASEDEQSVEYNELRDNESEDRGSGIDYDDLEDGSEPETYDTVKASGKVPYNNPTKFTLYIIAHMKAMKHNTHRSILKRYKIKHLLHAQDLPGLAKRSSNLKRQQNLTACTIQMCGDARRQGQ
ncbi:hypothetical protein QQX98_012050 [Neonectria punicea]|uniref:Uncharacterized protein n=1 Tax=Neonectria punicea TaxID=979145 RepID=A0ABR1GK23_9HYPO